MSFLQYFTLIFIYQQFSIINSSTSFVSPINKDQSTQLYTLSISIKTPLQLTDFLLDLGNKLSWIDCTSGYYISTTHHYIPCGTTKCNELGSLACSNCFRASGPGCHNNSCALFPENPVIKNVVLGQALVDTVGLTVSDGGQLGIVPNFVLSCCDESLLIGLPDGVTGLAGLGRSNYSLPAQVSSVYALPNIFALCLPSSTTSTLSGTAFFNTPGPYYFSPGIDLSSNLTYTPLIINPVSFTIVTYANQPSDEYFVGLTSININSNPLQLNRTLLTIDKTTGFGGTRLSTVSPYTILHTSIYNVFIETFMNETTKLNLTITDDPVSPFDVCYDAGDIYVTFLGPDVPVIDFVMEGDDENVNYWRMYGGNSMVNVVKENGEELWCLGFFDGGEDARTSVVIGGKQMEDNLLQFDLVQERFGFSSSVLVHDTNCSSFNFGYNGLP
uniref:probable aspartic proteinase GIP1 n=1 Tax=Erigeron canadensis TaxID=72917 RepID=UPI001CB8FDDD|nr:probable aspartic proteinase GIP1 [Erigeron canadensis]